MIPEFTMLVGLPGSGKSTFAEKYVKTHDAVKISSDEMRELILGDINDNSKEHQKELFAQIYAAIKNSLACNQNVVYDATNIHRKFRIALLDYLEDDPGVKCLKRCIILAKPYETCVEDISQRGRVVPVGVIENMYKHWQTPWYTEGFDQIEIVYPCKYQHKKPEDIILELSGFNQDNSHHSMSLADHMMETARRLMTTNGDDKTLCYAALLHDIGKPYTKSFTNFKGEETEEAHYFSHHNVGSYDSLFIDFPDDVDVLDLSNLICLHMEPYFWKSEETTGRYRLMWGDELFYRVMALHGADQLAH